MTLMDVAIAFHGVAAFLLIWAGAIKLATPRPSARLLGGLGLPAPDWGLRLAGCAELALGCFALAVGGPLAVAAVSCVYVLLALVVLRALTVGVSSCGCFGQADSPPSWIHVAGNLVLAAVSMATVASGRSPADVFLTLAGEHPVAAGALVLTVGVLAGLFAVTFTALPELLHARSRRGSDPGFVRVGIDGLSRMADGAGR